jgi:hypothetical protein
MEMGVRGPPVPLLWATKWMVEVGLRSRPGSNSMVELPRTTGLRPLSSSTVRYTPARDSARSVASKPSLPTSRSRSPYWQPAWSSSGRYGLSDCSKIIRRTNARKSVSLWVSRWATVACASSVVTGRLRKRGRCQRKRPPVASSAHGNTDRRSAIMAGGRDPHDDMPTHPLLRRRA